MIIENEKHRYLYMYVGVVTKEIMKKTMAEGKSVPYSNHNPDYQVDLKAIPLGAKVGAASLPTLLAR